MQKVVFFILSIVIFSCSQAQSQKNLKLDEFVETYKKTENAVLLDVRTPGEWQQGKLESSTCINLMDQSFKEQVAKLDKDTPLFVYCKVGGRSAQASKVLEEMGFTKVHNLQSAGYDDLAKKGLK